MASIYEYAALADVEAYTGLDYSVINAQFTQVNVDAKISIAERMVNGYLGKDGAQTITDGIKAATIMIAAKILHLNLADLGFHGDEEHTQEIVDMSVQSILRMFLGYDAGVDAIPMSGADR